MSKDVQKGVLSPTSEFKIAGMHQVVTAEEWKAARAELLEDEKAASRLLASLAVKRRQMPMVKVEKPANILFTNAEGKQESLLDLFGNCRQLILYDFMFYDEDQEGCVGCSFVMDHVSHLSHLRSRDTTFAAVAPTAIEKITPFKERMGWGFPFYSTKNTFNGTDQPIERMTWKPNDGPFGIAVILRQEEDVFHTYSTEMRGVKNMLSTYTFLDLTPLGRREVGNGILQFRHHDRYSDCNKASRHLLSHCNSV